MFDTVAALPLIVAVVSETGNTYPLFAVSVTVEVYAVLPANVVAVGLHATVPAAKFAVSAMVAVGLGVAPVTGAVTVIAASVIKVAVAAKVCDSVTVVLV